jgi:acyl-CoA thioesterase
MTLDEVKQKIQEHDRLGRLLGVEILEVNKGSAVTQLTVTEDHLNAANVAHGGTVFSLADIALAAASNSYGEIALLTNGSITFFGATQPGETLTARAVEIGASRKLGHYRVDVSASSGGQIAVFNATVYRTGKPLG